MRHNGRTSRSHRSDRPASKAQSNGHGGGHQSNGRYRGQAERSRRYRRHSLRPVLITGGAGFVGTNVAARLLQDGRRVMILDNLSRPGVEGNLQWLVRQFGSDVDICVGDVRDAQLVSRAVACASHVFHFAAQVAVTTSLLDPETDFEINAQGTVNVLEAVRRSSARPPLLFTSTNKVYGDLGHLEVTSDESRYWPTQRAVATHGVSEQQTLDFHSPYGCSKGVADQYVLDYARCYQIPTVVFRMSCIYGPHQCGTEDQGWVAHFLLKALQDEPITIFGDGKQVRDTLFVDDLVEAMLLALNKIEYTRGSAFNMGGGPAHACSLLELLDLIHEVHGLEPDVRFADWRQGDQRYYVSDTRAFEAATGWKPKVTVAEGVRRLYDWLRKNRSAVASSTLV